MSKKITKIPMLFRKKFNNKSGETIAETLVTMIILSLAVLMLAGAVVTSARVNKKADNTDTAFSTDGASASTKNIIITDKSETGTDNTITVTTGNFYTTKNKYKYYEIK